MQEEASLANMNVSMQEWVS